MRPVEVALYWLSGVDEKREQHWLAYAVGMLLFNLGGFLILYILLRLQAGLPLNPAGMAAVPEALSFNTAMSFTTNTNWQNYGGESTLSYLTQMLGLTSHNFLSAATGIVLAVALIRGFARGSARTVGNFWVDVTRCTIYILIPICIPFALFLVWQGMPQTLGAYVDATTLEGATQTIAVGPVASQVAIKMLGTNGGGFFNANAAHPFENPTAAFELRPRCSRSLRYRRSALTYFLGRMVEKPASWLGDPGRAMFVLFIAGVIVVYVALRVQQARSVASDALGLVAADGNMEGKEVRFGIAAIGDLAFRRDHDRRVERLGQLDARLLHAARWHSIPLCATCRLGEVVFGGVGSGLYGMLICSPLSRCSSLGLMVGRTPEYLGKKIEAYEVKMAMLAILITAAAILGARHRSAVRSPEWAGAARSQSGPARLQRRSSIAFSSAVANNNGSAFAGITANATNGDIHYNRHACGIAMWLGRFLRHRPHDGDRRFASPPRKHGATSPPAPSRPTRRDLFVGLLVGRHP